MGVFDTRYVSVVDFRRKHYYIGMGDDGRHGIAGENVFDTIDWQSDLCVVDNA